MGISRLKRLLTEELSRVFTTREIQLFLNEIDNSLSLQKLTGYPEASTIPRKEAAKQVVDHLNNTNRLTQLLNLYITVSRTGFKGENVTFHNLKSVIKEMDECGLKYVEKLKKVAYVDQQKNSRGWGFLEEGSTNNFCFCSIDICGNTGLVKKYDINLVRETYKNFKSIVLDKASLREGRIWSWEGDGGLVVFHLNDFINTAIIFSIDILASMPYFNACHNLLGEDIKIRIGINAGTAEYKYNAATITSDSIEKTKQIEKNYTNPMSLSVSKSTFQHINRIIRDKFEQKIINEALVNTYTIKNFNKG